MCVRSHIPQSFVDHIEDQTAIDRSNAAESELHPISISKSETVTFGEAACPFLDRKSSSSSSGALELECNGTDSSQSNDQEEEGEYESRLLLFQSTEAAGDEADPLKWGLQGLMDT